MGITIKTKGKIVDPVKMEATVITPHVGRVDFDPATTGRYQNRATASFIQAGDHNYFVDDLSQLEEFGKPFNEQIGEVSELKLLTVPPLWGNTIFQTLLTPGDAFEIPLGRRHQMIALEDSELFEFSTQHFEDDSYRIEKGD